MKKINKYWKKIVLLSNITLSLIIRVFTRVVPGRIILWSSEFKAYSDSPRYLSDFLLKHKGNKYEIVWVFKTGVITEGIPDKIRKVSYGSFKYYYYLNSAEYLVTNHRTVPWRIFWFKRKGQKYIMTWHGSMPIKKIEGDAYESLGENYKQDAILDSKACDLILTDNKWMEHTIRRAFWYDGEILTKGVPRNDVYFDPMMSATAIRRVRNYYNIDNDTKIMMYAPTFRDNADVSHYLLHIKDIIIALENKFACKFVAVYRLHPNLLKVVDSSTFVTDIPVIDASKYPDMQELIVASDVLITDYSSTLCEFAMIGKPCFLYADDLKTYNRGLYIDFKTLPYEIAETVEEMVDIINNVDIVEYVNRTRNFVLEFYHPITEPIANASIADWMEKHKM